jgi:hypothetical protein
MKATHYRDMAEGGLGMYELTSSSSLLDYMLEERSGERTKFEPFSRIPTKKSRFRSTAFQLDINSSTG